MGHKKIKKASRRTKLIIILLFILLVIFLFFFNKATINGLIPIDYIEDPLPFQKACPLPDSSPQP